MAPSNMPTQKKSKIHPSSTCGTSINMKPIPIIDLCGDDGSPVERTGSHNTNTIGMNILNEGIISREENARSDSAIHRENVTTTTSATNRNPARKRKFCEIMSRCFLCCFPVGKRRRIMDDLINDDDDICQ